MNRVKSSGQAKHSLTVFPIGTGMAADGLEGGRQTAFEIRPASRLRTVVVILAFLIAALDGYDVLAAAYTAPAIADAWRLHPNQIGLLLSSGLAGMGFGALFFGPLGDKRGRRQTILCCLAILLVGMCGTATAAGLSSLIAWRLFTGLGIGGVLVNINILTSEYSGARYKHLTVSVMAIGYPIGATLGGFLAVFLIQRFGWPYVYVAGGVLAAVLLPPTYLFLPESIQYLTDRVPAGALRRVNVILQRMGSPPLDRLAGTSGLSNLAETRNEVVAVRNGVQIVIASAAYFMVMVSVYFLVSWTPRLVAQTGLGMRVGILVSSVMNFAGCLGCLLYGFTAHRVGAQRLAIIFMVGLCLAASIFGLLPSRAVVMMAGAFAIGFCMHSSIAALYVIVPQSFPTSVRASSTGFAMSLGRVGAALGPFVAGLLITSGYSRTTLFVLMSLPMLASACLIVFAKAQVSTDLITTGGSGVAGRLVSSHKNSTHS